MVAISPSPSRSSNNSPAAAGSSGRFSLSSSSSSPSNASGNHSSNSRNSSQLSCRFLTLLSFLVLAQFLLLPVTVHYYLSSSASLQQQQAPLLSSISRTRTIQSNNQLDSFQQQRQKKSNYDVNGYRDGTFNGAPLRLKTVTLAAAAAAAAAAVTKQEQQQQHVSQQHPLSTRIHCVGENYNAATAWQQRSCEFQHLFCFNTSSQRFVVFQSQSERLLSDFLTQRVYDMQASSTLIRYKSHNNNNSNNVESILGKSSSSIMVPRPEQTMSIGGINKKWGDSSIQRLEWFPDIVSEAEASSSASTTTTTTPTPNGTTSWQYYELPPSYIMIPYHSLNGANPGHLIWDDYMPIYSLLTMFQKINHLHQHHQDRHQLLLMRVILDNNVDHQGNLQRGLWASCDMNEEKTKACHKMMNKFIPLMLGYNTSLRWSTIHDFDFQPADSDAKVDLVCARTGLAGIGSLTDHGVSKLHGWEENDYKTTHNHGRGGLVYDFRNFMLSNLGFASPQHESIHQWRRYTMLQARESAAAGGDTDTALVLPPHRIVFSQKSSDIPNRNLEFTQQIAAVKKFIPHASVEAYIFKDLSLQEQMQVAVQSSVFITLCGGGAVTGMFLPRGASVILYYDARGGAENNHLTGLPARLDWDLYNAMTHLRVHWLPKNTAKDVVDQMSLVLLIRHELARIDQEAEEEEDEEGDN